MDWKIKHFQEETSERKEVMVSVFYDILAKIESILSGLIRRSKLYRYVVFVRNVDGKIIASNGGKRTEVESEDQAWEIVSECLFAPPPDEEENSPKEIENNKRIIKKIP